MRRQKFINWCKKDVNDETKINYTCKISDNEIIYCTSEEEVGYPLFRWIQEAYIESIYKENNEWYVTLIKN